MRTVALVIIAILGVGVAIAAVWSRSGAREAPDSLIWPAIGRTLDVSVKVDHILDEYDVRGLYSGRSVVTFENHGDRPIKVKLPVVRRLGISPNAVEYMSAPESGPFAEARVLTLAPKATVVIETDFEMLIGENPSADALYAATTPPYRYGWVFDVPDGEKPDDWLSGTIISEPVRWRPAGGAN